MDVTETEIDNQMRSLIRFCHKLNIPTDNYRILLTTYEVFAGIWPHSVDRIDFDLLPLGFNIGDATNDE